MAPTTTYLVQVFESPHWRDVLSTKDKQKAEDAKLPLGKLGRIQEIKTKVKPVR